MIPPVPSLTQYLELLSQFDGTLQAAALVGLLIAGVFTLINFRHLQSLDTAFPPVNQIRQLVPTMFLALFLRLIRFPESLWYDETFTAAMAATDISKFPTALLGDVHPPLAYLIMRFSALLFGMNEFGLRLPSLVASLLVVWLVWLIANEVFNSRAAYIAALLTAVLPGIAYYGAEARYPMLLAAVVLAALLMILKNKPRWFAVAIALAPWLHSTGWLYVAVLLTVAIVWHGFRWRWFRSGVLVVILTAPVAALAYIQTEHVISGFWLQARAPFVHMLTTSLSASLPSGWLQVGGMALVVFLSAVALVSALATGKPLKRAYIYSIAILVPFLAWFVGIVFRPVYLPRTMLAATLILVIFWSGWIATLSRRWRSSVLALLIGYSGAAHGYNLYNQLTDNFVRTDMDNKFFAHCADADVIHTVQLNLAIPAEFYAPDGVDVVSWYSGQNNHQRLTQNAIRALNIDQVASWTQLTGDVCIVAQYSYYTEENEIEYLTAVADTAELVYSENNQLYAYQVYWLYDR
ncbi:MAG: glycosyltransferase family 39 protein [Anaerolineae bacterium]|nr:glycosyltransferase family 39 protein [Anaerolineae bacterium]